MNFYNENDHDAAEYWQGKAQDSSVTTVRQFGSSGGQSFSCGLFCCVQGVLYALYLTRKLVLFRPCKKKGKENQAAPKLLGHVDSVMIHKTSAMATHCQTGEWAAWESWGKPLCLLYLARASPWLSAPQYCGGNLREDLLFFHRSHSCQSGAHNCYLQLLHLSRKTA